MNTKGYTVERGQQIVLSLLKQHGIKRVIASPGTTNITLVASMQQDPWFEMYSSVDERSAAYMACGMAAETGEPVVLSCTGATASRNYVSGLTEAYYRKLPILAITATQDENRLGHLVAQMVDRSSLQKDIAVCSEHISSCSSLDEEWNATIRVNRAILALTHHGGGPVHINLTTTYNCDFSAKELPIARKICRYALGEGFPEIPTGKTAIWVGSHTPWNEVLTEAVDTFCAKFGAVVFCDHTSNYHGNYKAFLGITSSQRKYISPVYNVDTLIHIGEVSADYNAMGKLNAAKSIWRVNSDGVIRDLFKKLTNVFEMHEINFFNYYTNSYNVTNDKNFLLEECLSEEKKMVSLLPELPFSNIWIAEKTSSRLPQSSIVHFGILNSVRSWNFWPIHPSINTFSNTGGFGIDGGMSSCIGSSLVCPDKIHFLFIGDLAFFYDMNSIGNRHVGNNLRILLVNNGRGTEFRNYSHPGSAFGVDADAYIAAAGHYGAKSSELVKHYAEDLGYEYITASSKESFLASIDRFLNPEVTNKPIVFEIFTDTEDESNALQTINHLVVIDNESVLKKIVRKIIPQSAIDSFHSILK